VPAEVLANATIYLEACGHTVLAWIWLDIAVTALRAMETAAPSRPASLHGLLQATRYFFDYELPQVAAWLQPVASRNPACRDMHDDWF
jgi:butyryl-CoA dehydrogenase